MSTALKNRLKNYSFWVSLASAILLLVQAIGKPLGLVINEEIYMSIVNSVLGVFVVLGIISHPAQNLLSSKDTQTETDTVVISESTTQSQNNGDTNTGQTNTNEDVTQNSIDANCVEVQNGSLATNSNNTQVVQSQDTYSETPIDTQTLLEKSLAPNANYIELSTENTSQNSVANSQNQSGEIVVNGVKLQTKQTSQSNTIQNFSNTLGGVEQDNKSNSTNSTNNSTIA